MLFRVDTGQWQEPVREMSSTVFDRPVLHFRCHDIRDVHCQFLVGINGFLQGTVRLLRQSFPHHCVIEHHTSI